MALIRKMNDKPRVTFMACSDQAQGTQNQEGCDGGCGSRAILSASIAVLLSGMFACAAKAGGSPEEFFAKPNEEPESYFSGGMYDAFDTNWPWKLLFGETARSGGFGVSIK